jgi:hypothetical protein
VKEKEQSNEKNAVRFSAKNENENFRLFGFFFLLDYDFCFGLFEFMKLIFTFVTLLVTRAPYAFSFLFFH